MTKLNRLSWPQLYLITHHDNFDDQRLKNDVQTVLQQGVKIIQYRDKSADKAKRQRQANLLRNLTAKYNAVLIINDDIQLAKSCTADGVHLGREDGLLQQAREQLGDQAIIGFSCYNQFERAQYAAANGASYIAFGRFFQSRTKPDAPIASTHLIIRAQQELELPVVAIGGVTPDNASTLLQAGVNMIAVIDAVFGQPEIAAATQRFTQRLNQG